MKRRTVAAVAAVGVLLPAAVAVDGQAVGGSPIPPPPVREWSFTDYDREAVLHAWYGRSAKWRQHSCDLYQRPSLRGFNRAFRRLERTLYRTYPTVRGWDREERRGLVSWAIVQIYPDC